MAVTASSPGPLRESRAQVEQKWQFPLEGTGVDLKVAGDGSLLAVGGISRDVNGIVYLLDRSGKLLWKYVTREPIRAVAVSDVGGFVVAGCDDSQVYFFDRRGLLLWRYKCDRRVTTIGISRDGTTLAAGSEDNNVYYFDNKRELRRFAWKIRLQGVVTALSVVPSGENILAGGSDGGIYFLDSKDGSVAWKSAAREAVLAVATSKFADLMAVGTNDGAVACFDFGGRQVWERRTGGPVVDVSVDNRGAVVAALSRDGALYFFDARGSLLWSHQVGPAGGRVKVSKNGDLVFCTTGDGRLLCLSASEGLIFEAKLAAEPVALDVSADSEEFSVLEAGALRTFETKVVFKSLILSLRDYILRCRDRGLDIHPALSFEKGAVTALKNFDYKGVFFNVFEAEKYLHAAVARLTEDSEVQRRAADAIARLRKIEAEGVSLGLDTSAVKAVIDQAAGAINAKEFSRALQQMQEASGAFTAVERQKDELDRARRQIELTQAELERTLQFEGVDVTEADRQLKRAEEEFRLKNYPQALEFASLALEFVLKSRRRSPKAIEAELSAVRAEFERGPLDPTREILAEGAVLAAIAHYAAERRYKELGESYLLYHALLDDRAKRKGEAAPARLPLEQAAFAFLDAGDGARAAEVAERALDYKLAAKLREKLKQQDEARRVLSKLGTEQRARRSELAAESKKVDDYIGSLISSKKFAQAAAELLKFERFPEAISLLEGQRNPLDAAYLLRIYFHLGQYDRLLAACSAAEAALREEIARGNAELLPLFGRFVAGHTRVAQILGLGHEIDRAADARSYFLQEHARRERANPPERDLDAVAVLLYLQSGERERVRTIVEGKQGPFYEWIRDAEVMLERGNLKGFRKMLQLFQRDHVSPAVHIGSTLKSLVPPSDVADALDELYPFNTHGQILMHYRMHINADFFKRLLQQGDQFLASKDYERALPFFAEVAQRDVFRHIPKEQIAARIAGIYLARKDKERASQVIEELGAGESAVSAAMAKVPGLLDVALEPSKKPSAPEGKRCPSCGELVPKVAVRCFRCGASIR